MPKTLTKRQLEAQARRQITTREYADESYTSTRHKVDQSGHFLEHVDKSTFHTLSIGSVQQKIQLLDEGNLPPELTNEDEIFLSQDGHAREQTQVSVKYAD